MIALVIALLVPRWYVAEVRLVQPEGSMLSLSGLLGQVGGGLSGLIGGGSGGYEKQLSIFSSRSYRMQLMEEFGLIERYENTNSPAPIRDTMAAMEETLVFEVDIEFFFLSIKAHDQDPAFAARLAGRAAELLNDESIRISALSARQTREYIQERLRKAERSLDSVRVALQEFQEEYGLIEVETQAAAYFQGMGEQRGRLAELTVQYETLSRLYGPDNSQVIAAREGLRAAQREMGRSLGGRDQLFPVAMADLPALSRTYVELKQEELIQAKTLEGAYPLYEQALFEEENEADVLVTIDEAMVPEWPAYPSRLLLVILLTVSAFLMVCLFVIVRAWLREVGPLWLRRFRAEIG